MSNAAAVPQSFQKILVCIRMTDFVLLRSPNSLPSAQSVPVGRVAGQLNAAARRSGCLR